MKKTLLTLFILFSISCFSQFSKTHYIPPLTCSTNLAGDQYLYISTPSINNVNFKIIANGIPIIINVVKNDTPFIYNIGQGQNTQLFTPKNSIGIVTNKGFIIEAEDLIYVSVRVNAGFSNQNNSYNHAGGLVSKGNSALGKEFRLGAMLNPVYDQSVLNFASVLATENGTKITISNIENGTRLSDGAIISGPIEITLNKNESYVLALENYNTSISNSSKMIGALVESDKPVVVNSGSFGGSNSTVVNIQGNPTGRDVGFDQIVPTEKTGKEYIFVKGPGTDELERVLLIANEAQTDIYLNDVLVPFTTLNNPGDYIVIDGSQFIDGNLYVTTSQNVSAYQSIGGSSSNNNPPANQNLFFVPPLNCATPNNVDNIPYIESIGATFYNGGLNIVTENGAAVTINGNPISTPAFSITGNNNYVRYTVSNLIGNIAVKSTRQVYVSYFGTNGAATYGGYYSGFDTKPEIITDKILVSSTACIPNIILKINTLSSYDSFQWYFNDIPIDLANTNSYNPTQPGYYQVKGSIANCPNTIPIFSDKIPVSSCDTDMDKDGINDNIDIDNDNDGILNCTESYGNKGIDISDATTGVIVQNDYSNSFLGTISTSATPRPRPFTGSSDGVFITDVAAGKENFVTYKMNFDKPISVQMSYVNTASSSDLLNADAEYIINSDINKTLTVLNPNDQLVIDTNYDGIYESGVTQFTSFEIRFRLNSAVPLAAGTGTFKFLSYLTNSLSIKHKNLSDTDFNKGTFKIEAVCIPRDSDGDGLPDQEDLDSDNDGIPDTIEAQINAKEIISNLDANKNGLDDAFEPGFIPQDTDNDGVADYLDEDSDNDGITDNVETGDDFDGDGIGNFRDLDSDEDLCSDVTEAGFTDPDSDGKFGNSPLTVDLKGRVIGAPYTAPNPNYLFMAPIVITTQPNVVPTCELQNAAITVVDNGGNTYQWQLSIDGDNWTTLTNSLTYPDVTANPLTVNGVTNAMNNYKYRVILNKFGNSCSVTSAETTLTVYALPLVNDITIIQCDDDLDAVTTFNLTVKNDVISSNSANETFTYYKTLSGANTADAAQLITTPIAFTNDDDPGSMTLWTRVENTNGCFRTAKLTLQVLVTNIPSTYTIPMQPVCDDLLDTNGNNNTNNDKRDGIATFDLSATKTTIQNLLPITTGIIYNINYYRNQADALSELNVISDISKYRNIGYPNTQDIWVRVDSDVDNACFGLGPFVTLTVEKLPFANPVSISRQCDDNHDGIFTFDTAALETTLLGSNQSFPVTVAYFDAINNPLKDGNGALISSPFPETFTTASQTITAVVTNSTTQECFDKTAISFIIDDLPEAFAVPIALTTTCDDELDPLVQDGKFAFETSSFQSTILGGQTGMNVKYIAQDGNVLPSPLPNPFVTSSQNVKVIVENPINTSCFAEWIIPFVVTPLPNIRLNTNEREDELVCSNLPTFFIQLNAGIQDGSPEINYTYMWSKDGDVLAGKTAYTLDVNTEGLYTVEVFNNLGCSRIRTLKVTASDIAVIQTIDVVDMTDLNTVTINVTGAGDYEYSLNEASGYFQDSNIFNNVPAGIHEVFINDKNGCGIVSKTIAVVGMPKFFTPNSDGYNDYWSPKGVNAAFNSKSTIYIFDRYGKLLKQWVPGTTEGWDGTFNGNPLPSDDYWYTIKLEDSREAKGHFSLKR